MNELIKKLCLTGLILLAGISTWDLTFFREENVQILPKEKKVRYDEKHLFKSFTREKYYDSQVFKGTLQSVEFGRRRIRFVCNSWFENQFAIGIRDNNDFLQVSYIKPINGDYLDPPGIFIPLPEDEYQGFRKRFTNRDIENLVSEAETKLGTEVNVETLNGTIQKVEFEDGRTYEAGVERIFLAPLLPSPPQPKNPYICNKNN